MKSVDIQATAITHDSWAMTRDFQQFAILTSVDSDEPV